MAGAFIVFMPEVAGNGCEPLNRLLDGHFTVGFVALLLVGRIVATTARCRPVVRAGCSLRRCHLQEAAPACARAGGASPKAVDQTLPGGRFAAARSPRSSSASS